MNQDRTRCSELFILHPSSFILRGLPNFLTLLLLLLLVAVWLRPFADLDFAWQVRTGGQIVDSGSLRIQDNLTYTIAGKQLPDFAWLYEVGLWSVWSIAGYGGLHLLKV